jgi:hypothetical protein
LPDDPFIGGDVGDGGVENTTGVQFDDDKDENGTKEQIVDHGEITGPVLKLPNNTQENDRWGYGKIEGELLKLGHKVSQTSIRNILDQHGVCTE